MIQSRIVGRAEISGKPDITWKLPERDRLYERLAVKFELRDRAQALTRKRELIQLAANNRLGLLNSQRTLRVEWYIVILILAEILLFLYRIGAVKSGCRSPLDSIAPVGDKSSRSSAR